MLPISVDPRAKKKMTGLQPPPMRWVYSFEVVPTRLLSCLSTRTSASGIAAGAAKATVARVETRMAETFMFAVID